MIDYCASCGGMAAGRFDILFRVPFDFGYFDVPLCVMHAKSKYALPNLPDTSGSATLTQKSYLLVTVRPTTNQANASGMI